jgi:hypothetical protein
LIVYLDQNKWIELARMFHGRDTTTRAVRILGSFENWRHESGVSVPLSTEHYIETARISNVGRKARLGQAMWHFSRGETIAGYPTIVRHELEVALTKHFPRLTPGTLSVLGRGHAHAFGTPPLRGLLAVFAEEVERSILTGHSRLGIQPPAFHGTTARENFRQHLSTFYERYHDVPKELRENWLYAMSTMDILDPLNDIAAKHNLDPSALESLGETGLKQVIDDMPTRRVDMHLHREVVKNKTYVARSSDLEDWGALTVASCYCDVVICEKHMASMLRRNGSITNARIEVDLEKALRAA